MKFLIFDILLYFFGALTYSISLFLTYLLGQQLWSDSIVLNCLVLFLCFVVFIHLFIITLSILKIIFQPKLITGDFPIGMNKDYIAWGLNSVFCGLYLTAPFAQFGHLLFSTNWLFYKGMGMKVPFNALIGLKSTIRQPELISIGNNSVIGLGSIMSCHFTADGKTHTQKPIKIGNRSVVGGYAGLGPGVTIGDHSVIGAESRVFPDVTLGNKVTLGAFCYIDHGVVIPDNVKIKSYTRITKEDAIKSNEIWAGNPAQKVGDLT